jgi:glutamyl-tRNA synthetase
MGIARSALLSWLRARQQGGTLVMRIEDLDPPRVVKGSAEAICADLRWLGLDWDEGPDVGGAHGPYAQSQRFALYAEAIERLRAQGLLFACACSRKELQQLASEASAPHGDADLGPRYPGTCLRVPPTTDRPMSLRFAMPRGEAFVDLVRGVQPESEPDDFVVQRVDGLYAYQLAVVVDDIAMGITEVVRGEDLLSSTPRQIALYRALGATPPAFAHVPLMLTPDGRRLSKRSGSVSIAERRAAGARPEQIIGELAASVGFVPQGTIVAARELIAGFELKGLTDFGRA